MKKLSHPTNKDHKIVYNEDDTFETQLAKEYRNYLKDRDKQPNWQYIPGTGKVGFVGSGRGSYRVTIMDVIYIVTVERYANGKTFWGTNHSLSYRKEALDTH